MNTTTTGCAICDFYYNGRCFYDKACIGQAKTRTYATNSTGGYQPVYNGPAPAPPASDSCIQNASYNYCPYCGKKLG